jgi:hypothetical protein
MVATMHTVRAAEAISARARVRSGQGVQLRLDVIAIVLLSLALATVSFLIQGDIGLDLGDEGHAWYATTRTALGDVPLRDFRSYDPGRYYWGAAWFKLLGPGIISLRIGMTMMQALGLVFGLLTLRRVVHRWWLLVILAALLLTWMVPIFKAFESATVLALVWLAVRLLEAPTPARHFSAGVGVGLAAFIRLDHGLYAAIAFSLLLLFQAARSRTVPARDAGAVAAGTVVGYLPMLVMLVAVPGFFGGLVEHLAFLIRITTWNGTPNLGKPVPWPWLAGAGVTLLERLYSVCVGLLFLAVPLLYPAAAVIVLRRSPFDDTPGRRLVVAAGAVGVMYAHYTFARPDLEHLAQSIHPLIILVAGLLAMLAGRRRAIAIALVLPLVVTVSTLTAGVKSRVYRWAAEINDPYIPTRIADDVLWLHPGVAVFLETVRRTADELLAPGERILIAPHWPALYAMLGRESPTWETYFIFPESEERQRRTIVDLQRRNVAVVLLGDLYLDGRADLHFSKTHPLVYRHVMERYDKVPVPGLPGWAQFFRRKPQAVLAP